LITPLASTICPMGHSFKVAYGDHPPDGVNLDQNGIAIFNRRFAKHLELADRST
jgi:hypothetical protein